MKKMILPLYIGTIGIIALIISIHYLAQPFTLNLDKLALILLGCGISYFFVENKENRRFSVETVTILIIILFSNMQGIVVASIFMSLSTLFGKTYEKEKLVKGLWNSDNIFMVSKVLVSGFISSNMTKVLTLDFISYYTLLEMLFVFIVYMLLNETLTFLYRKLREESWKVDLKSESIFVFFTLIAAIFTSYVYYDRGLILTMIVYIFLIPFHQMTNLYALYRLHEEKVMRDDLTGLYNFRFFRTKIEEKVRKKEAFSLLMLDLDGFKQINDTYGHLAGDEALKVFAKLILSHIRRKDLVFRYAGDEFCILLNDKEDVEGMVERLKGIVNNIEFNFENQLIKIGSSIGQCDYDGEFLNAEQVIDYADKKLYQNKKRRKQKEGE